MKNRTIAVLLATVAILALLWAAGSVIASPPREGPDTEVGAQEEVGVTAIAPGAIHIQGRLTDSTGSPLNGTYNITFRLYDVETGGTPLCSDTNSVEVEDGLFSTYMDYCYDDLYGQKVWLGIEVEGNGEMTPRQVIYPVPYALSLRPGAVISYTRDVILTVRSTGSGDKDAFFAYAGDTGEAVSAHSPNGIAVWANSDNFLALQAYSYENTDNPAIFGCSADSAATCDPYRNDNAAGVMGYSQYDYGGYFVGGSSGDGGIHAEANYQLGVGVWAENNGHGMAIYAEGDAPAPPGHAYPTLYLVQKDSGGDFVVGASSWLGTRYWRVDRTGKGYFNGGTQTGGADFAEQMAVEGDETDYEPGDVLVISGSADRMVELSAEPFATTVIGVYSTKPALLAGAPDTDAPLEGIPVAITGIAPCKVSAENGPIHRGDLLVTSSTPGHAMKAGPNPPQGTVLGKALGELKEGTGVIEVLVTLH